MTDKTTTTTSLSPYSFDHIIILLSTEDFENPPEWVSRNFTIMEGGTHAGGSSRNKLIIFPDGTYLELINWITKPAEFFDWASKSHGLIDFALTSPSTAHETFAEVTKRLEGTTDTSTSSPSSDKQPGDGNLGIRYNDPLAGGRQRKDGQHVKWHVTKPRLDNTASAVPAPFEKFFPTGRLDTPFFCHDVTERSLRVPYEDKTLSETHPCGAKGVLSVEVLVPEGSLERYTRLYESVLGVAPELHEESESKSAKFPLSTPIGDDKVLKALKGRVGVEIRTPRDEEDEVWLKERGVGIRKVKIFAAAKGQDEVSEATLDSQGTGVSLALVKDQL